MTLEELNFLIKEAERVFKIEKDRYRKVKFFDKDSYDRYQNAVRTLAVSERTKYLFQKGGFNTIEEAMKQAKKEDFLKELEDRAKREGYH